jgi:hypothetical protein
MGKSRFTRGNASFVGIRKPGSCSVPSDTDKNEKDQTHAIDLKGLRALGQIVLAIKKRIDAADNPGSELERCPVGSPSSSKTPGPNSGKDCYTGETQER